MSEHKVWEGHRFLDPAEVDSSVGWAIVVETHPSHVDKKGGLHNVRIELKASVKLTDCSRLITWTFAANYDEDVGEAQLTKLDNAIDQLTRARAALARAHKYYDAQKRKHGIKNEPR